jgi:pyruvate-formate lyase-activating enzyme
MEEGAVGLKARLLSLGEVYVEPDCVLPRTFSRSTAGPGAGAKALVFSFRDARVKLAVSGDERTPLHLTRDGEFKLKGEVMAKRVRTVPILLHCPGQAFVNLEAVCSLDCAYCTTPLTPRGIASRLTEDRIVEMILRAAKEPSFGAVAITGGVGGSPRGTLEKMVRVVGRARRELPDAPIGVEPYVEDPRWVDELKAAGADELKVNVEAATERLFRRVCPGRDRKVALAALERGVQAFGKGRVASNVIFGLGETDEELAECTDSLAAMGVVPNLRALRVDAGNRGRLRSALGYAPRQPPASRMLKVAAMHREALERRGLTTLTFKTMCFPCQCCDIVPFRDL